MAVIRQLVVLQGWSLSEVSLYHSAQSITHALKVTYKTWLQTGGAEYQNTHLFKSISICEGIIVILTVDSISIEIEDRMVIQLITQLKR